MASFSESKFAAWLHKIVSYRRQEIGLYRKIASHLPFESPVRVLDEGTRTGLQLRAIHDRVPAAELFGLDLIIPANETARIDLMDVEVDQ